ncbi:unnamed protein product [Caenorhabditis bovis]|uniref:glutathione transferase n=1 Tax=Caenorhabditis bovis TaxID=2654633 RepID=A0A8S1ESA9_9PELO|nr:unnamed protein product [Caenorhabditis bovis]
MVHYKLTYFDARGLAESTRQMFYMAGVEFEDVRISNDNGDWPKLKPSTPLGQLPVLSVDGFEIPQSAAIARYVARKFGFAGKTPEEEAWVDAFVDLFKDFMNALRAVVIPMRNGKPAEEIEKIRNEVYKPAEEAYFGNLKKFLAKSKSGFLVGDSVTFADLIIADNLFTLQENKFNDLVNEPELINYQKKIYSLPKLKEWIEKRPVTLF